MCVGEVDPNVISHLFSAAEGISLSLDNCGTVQEGYRKIRTSIYDVYIIQMSDIDKTIIDLLREIKRRKEEKGTLVLILGPEVYFHDELEDNGLIDFVLHKPISPQQIDRLISDICKKCSVTLGSSVLTKMQELKQKYENTIYDKIELLTTLCIAVQKNPNKSTLSDLKTEVHKIAGSAGSYGYTAVSALCKELDAQISEKVQRNIPVDNLWLSSLDEFLKKVKKGFQSPALKESKEVVARAFISQPQIYVVDPDIKFLELIERVKVQYSLEISVESDPKKALDRLKRGRDNPNGLIVSQSYPGSEISGYELIEVLQGTSLEKAAIYGLFLSKDSIENRLEASQKDVDFIFSKPISVNKLLKTMKDALEVSSMRHFKVLVLDDDHDFCMFVKTVLSEIGITVKTIYDSDELFTVLEDFRPHILLLDFILPKYDGLKLLKTLKQDALYQNLVIVIVTSSEETQIKINAYVSKAEDILYKPIDPKVLQERLLNLAQRYILKKESPDYFDYTGMNHVSTLVARLHECYSNEEVKSYLVLFEVANFSDLVIQEGQNYANKLLINISNQLLWEQAGSNVTCYSYNSAKFAMIFVEKDLEVIKLKTHQILLKLIQEEKQWKLNFNCTITPIIKKYENPQQIIQEAEFALEEARKKTDSSIRIVTTMSAEQMMAQKEVVLIDSDTDLLKILKSAFKAHGLIVKTYVEGGDALQDLLTYRKNEAPALIIAERKLADMDGLDLMRKINAHFDMKVPFYVLTLFAADKDVSDGLRQGVSEYITKPFNISILMQKALKTIFNK